MTGSHQANRCQVSVAFFACFGFSARIIITRTSTSCMGRTRGPKWSWLKIQIGWPPVNIRFNPTTKIGSTICGAPTPKWYYWFWFLGAPNKNQPQLEWFPLRKPKAWVHSISHPLLLAQRYASQAPGLPTMRLCLPKMGVDT